MKDFSHAAFAPDTIQVMKRALDSAVATLPQPVDATDVSAIAESILRTTREGERDPTMLQTMALLELKLAHGAD
jgi:hypothetical protein